MRSPSHSVVALSSPSTTCWRPSSLNAIPFGPSTRKSSTRHQMIAAPRLAITRPTLLPRTMAPFIDDPLPVIFVPMTIELSTLQSIGRLLSAMKFAPASKRVWQAEKGPNGSAGLAV